MTSRLVLGSPLALRKVVICVLTVVIALALGATTIGAQHGGHGGGAHVSAPAPHVSAPLPARPAPRPSAPPRPPSAVATPRNQSTPAVHPAPRMFAPPNPGFDVTAAGSVVENQASRAAGDTTIGFPRITVFPAAGRPFAPRTGVTFNGVGRSLWVTNNARPALSGVEAGRIVHGGPRRFRPRPVLPIYYPVFYPVGFFGGYGLGYGFGFGACDPFWGWSFGCEGFGYSNFYGDGYPPILSYNGPAEPDYLPVPSDGNTDGEQDEAVLYLKDGTVYLISDYWLADNRIHYVTSDGAEHTIDLDQVDLQKSVDVNARRGVTFTFTLRPSPDSGTPSDLGAAPAPDAQNAAPPQ
jgi:hypothetical protein